MRLEVTCDSGIVKLDSLTLIEVKVYDEQSGQALDVHFSRGNTGLVAHIWGKIDRDSTTWTWLRNVLPE